MVAPDTAMRNIAQPNGVAFIYITGRTGVSGNTAH